VGRVTGKPHTVEIWFAIEGATLYVLAGGRHRADFVRNAKKTPSVGVRIGERRFQSTALPVAFDLRSVAYGATAMLAARGVT
jgi:hypothetical protein